MGACTRSSIRNLPASRPVLLLLSPLSDGLERYLTARDAHGVDIIAYSRDATRFVA